MCYGEEIVCLYDFIVIVLLEWYDEVEVFVEDFDVC